MKRKYTFAAILGIIMAIASSYSADAHCGTLASSKMHKGHYNQGKLYSLHRCAFIVNKDSQGQRCAVTVTPEGKTYCE